VIASALTSDDLQRCERELQPLLPRERASAAARDVARSFNADVSDVRGALLEPARGLVEKGAVSPDLAACLERAVAELAFWRRVLLKAHPDAFESAPTPPDYLVRYLRS
jgi:hypothetical protein